MFKYLIAYFYETYKSYILFLNRNHMFDLHLLSKNFRCGIRLILRCAKIHGQWLISSPFMATHNLSGYGETTQIELLFKKRISIETQVQSNYVYPPFKLVIRGV